MNADGKEGDELSSTRDDAADTDGSWSAECEPELGAAIEEILTAARRLGVKEKRVVVAIDGGSGAGKSMVSRAMAERSEAVRVPVDDFYSFQIPVVMWEAFSASERLDHVFEWQRLRDEAIRALKEGRSIEWYRVDVSSGPNADGTFNQIEQLELGASVEKSSDTFTFGGKAIHVAAATDASPRMIKMLIQAGADVNQSMNPGTPLEVAARSGREGTVEMLRAKGAVG